MKNYSINEDYQKINLMVKREILNKIKEQDLKNVINNLINEYIKRGFTEEEIYLMTFYRY